MFECLLLSITQVWIHFNMDVAYKYPRFTYRLLSISKKVTVSVRQL